MKPPYVKESLAVTWVLALSAACYAADISSAAGWTAAAGLILVPAAVLLRFWGEPPRTMSEVIHEARR